MQIPLRIHSPMQSVMPDASNTVLYVVSAKPDGGNVRARALLGLGDTFADVVSVAPGEASIDENHLVTQPWPNPFGILRRVGLKTLQQRVQKYFLFPSNSVLFNMAVRNKLCERIQVDLNKGRNVTLAVTLPDHAFSLLGIYVKEKLPDINLVLDWQDLWSFDESYFNRVPQTYQQKLLNIESTAMALANMNIATNHVAQTRLVEHYKVPVERTRAITHHYNLEDYVDTHTPDASTKASTVKIGFLGRMFKPPKVPGEEILHALDEVVSSGRNFEFHLFGDTTPQAKNTADALTNKFTTIHPPKPHQEALASIAQCDYLLLILADLPNSLAIMHGKLSHYLQLNKPIIAIVPTGSYVQSLINQTGAGYVITTDENIPQRLGEILDNPNALQRRQAEIDKFDWREISKQWMEILVD